MLETPSLLFCLNNSVQTLSFQDSIWAIYDIIMVATEKFTDGDGNVITKQ